MNQFIKSSIFAGMALVILFMGYFAFRLVGEIRIHNALLQGPDRILSGMTLEEKVGQIIHVGMDGTTTGPDIIKKIKEQYAGGVILFARNLGSRENTEKLNQNLQTLAREAKIPPLFISIDQEGGRVVRVSEGTVQFPGAMATGQANDPELTEEAAFVTGYEMRKLGFNLILAPVLDVNNNPENPVINTRSYGSDPERVTRIGTAHARGIRQALSTPVIKHFPGHGDTRIDSHLALPTILKTPEELESLELIPFRAALKEGAEAVMGAHILFPSLDETYPATLSETILQGILRKRMNFDGIIMTDAMEMYAIAHNYSAEEAPRIAFRAGVDVILLTGQPGLSKTMYESLLQGFRTGELSEEKLNESVRRQIRLKLAKGLYTENGFPSPFNDILGPFFQKKFQDVQEQYEALARRYDGLENLNQVLTRKAIKSLRKPFAGLDPSLAKQSRVYYRSSAMKEEALRLGIPADRILPIHTKVVRSQIWEGEALKTKEEIQADENAVSEMSDNEIIFLEFDKSDTSLWNKLVSLSGKSPSTTLVGLYTGNPFMQLRIPERGALLSSFSRTDESRRSLLFRAFHGPVDQADLIMPE